MTVEVESLSTAIAIAQGIAWTMGVLVMLAGGLLLYFLVRPSRRARELPPPEDEAVGAEEMLRLVDRMESRLEVLERALADKEEGRAPRLATERVLEPDLESRPKRRTK